MIEISWFYFSHKDVDECANNDDDCDINAECNNIDGSYTCACNSGYSGDGKSCKGKYLWESR